MSNSINFGEAFENVIRDVFEETGRDSVQDIADLRAFASALMLDLADLVGEPGYERAVRAARDSVALRAAVAATMTADASDQRIVGAIGATLSLGAKLLAGGLVVV